MRTLQEKLDLLHYRAEELERQKEKRLMSVTGGLAAAMLAAIIFCVAGFSSLPHSLAETSYSGSSLLGDSVGGYIIVAIAAFAAASVITAFCIRRRNRRLIENQDERKEES